MIRYNIYICLLFIYKAYLIIWEQYVKIMVLQNIDII